MKWDDIPTQVLRDLWVARWGDTWMIEDMRYAQEDVMWKAAYRQVVMRGMFTWKDSSRRVVTLKEVPHEV